MHMVEKILNNTTPYGKIRASHEGSLHSSTLNPNKQMSERYSFGSSVDVDASSQIGPTPLFSWEKKD